MSRSFAVLRDPELVELFADQPELLAIADAIAATAPVRRKRRLHPRFVVASLAVVAVAVFALVAPWSGSRGGVLQQALAAVTTNSVLHVVLVSPLPETTIVDLGSGRTAPTTLRVETWFDAQRSLKRTLVSRGGETTSDVLETPQGVWSQYGLVPTCAWIAAHPVKATRLRVSCSSSGRNGTTPRKIAPALPAADPALAAFITGYQAALEAGTARNLGPGYLGKRAVYWIGFRLGGARPIRGERVAVDRESFRPLVYEATTAGRVVTRAQIVTVGSVAYTPSRFARAALDRHAKPSAGQVAKTRHVSRAVAEAALGGAGRALGASFLSLPLIDARIDQVTTGYGPLSGKAVTRAPGLEFIYGDSGGFLNGNAFLRLSEALSPQIAYGMDTEDAALKSGSLLLTRVGNETLAANGSASTHRLLWFGRMRAGPLYVALQGSSRQIVVRAAQALAKTR